MNQYCSDYEPVLVRQRSYIASDRYAVVLLSTTRVVMPQRCGMSAGAKSEEGDYTTR